MLPGCSPSFRQVSIRRNTGLVLVAEQANTSFVNVRFIKNQGNAFTADRGAVRFYNCIFSENKVDYSAGLAMRLLDGAVARMVNCNFWDNTGASNGFSQSNGSAIMLGDSTRAYVSNSIFQKNRLVFSPERLSVNGKAFVSHSIFFDYYVFASGYRGYIELGPGVHYGSYYPFFADPENEDFSIHPCSGLIDRGINDSIPSDLSTDLLGNDRIVNGTVDVGAVESLAGSFCDIVVRDTAASGPGSLREAVFMANAHLGPDTIRFDVRGEAPYVFAFEPQMELVDDRTVLDASTQPGWELGMIQFDGSPFNYCRVSSSGGMFTVILCEFGRQGSAVQVTGDSCEIYGIEFKGYQNYGLIIGGAHTIVGGPGRGNYFSTPGADPPPLDSPTGKGVLNAGYFSKFQSNIFNLWLDSRPAREIIIGGNSDLGEGNVFNTKVAFNNSLFSGVSGPSVLTEVSRITGNTFLRDANITLSFSNYNSPTSLVDVRKLRVGGPESLANHFENMENALLPFVDSTGRMPNVILDQNTYACVENLFDVPHFVAEPVTAIIDSAFTNGLYGTAPPGDSIQVYLATDTVCANNAPCMGNVFIGKTKADENGRWRYQPHHALELLAGAQVSVLTTDSVKGTTLFSPCQTVQCTEILLEIDTLLCFGETLEIEGRIYDTPGYYEDTLLFHGACPGLAKVNVAYLPEKASVIDTVLCAGEFLEINGIPYDRPVTGRVVIIPNVGVGGCDSTVVVNLAFIDLPSLFAADTLTLPGNDTLRLRPEGNYQSYLWQDGSTAPAFFLDGSDYPPGVYGFSLTVVDATGCLWVDSILVAVEAVVDVPVQPLPGAPQIRAFPNPSNGVITLEAEGLFSPVTLYLYNLQGRAVYHTSWEPARPLVMDTSTFPAGVYALHWRSATDAGALKLVVGAF